MKRRETGKKWLSLLVLFMLLLSTTTMTLCRRNRPPSVPVIAAFSACRPHDTLRVSVLASDPEDGPVSYMFAWGDTSHLDWSAIYASGTPVAGIHCYPDTGRYQLRVRARDELEAASSWSEAKEISIGFFPPFIPCEPQGVSSCSASARVSFSTTTRNPYGDSVYYQMRWGDGDSSFWSGPLAGGDTFMLGHSYLRWDTTCWISARARDKCGSTSSWSAGHRLDVFWNSSGSPSVPIKPLGDAISYRYSTENYRAASVDPLNNRIKYVYSWGDGRFDTTAFGNSGETLCAQHTWLTEGSFEIRALAINSRGAVSAGWSTPLSVIVGPNDMPNPPDSIGGEDGGILNQNLRLATRATDPNADDVYVIFYYDTTQLSRNSGWIGPVPGGTVVAFDSASYTAAGTYYVVAYAKDTKGAISRPSSVKTITIAPMEMSWVFQTPSGDAFYSSPALNYATGDTIVYVGCDNARVYGFDARTGSSRGTFASLNQDAFSSSPVISADGQRVYIADDGGWLYCLGASGLGSISHYPPNDTWVPGMSPFYSTPAVKGTALYVGRGDGYFYRFDDNAGALTFRAKVNTFADISSSPAISADGTRIVVGNDSGYVYCFDDTLGVAWKVFLGAPITSSPALTPSGVVYVGCDDARLYALNLADGGMVFVPFQANDFITSSPVVDADNTVYFATEDGTVFAVKNGGEVWHKTLPYGENVSATGCLAPDTTLIINTDDGTVYGLDANLAAQEPGRILYRIVWPRSWSGFGRRKTARLASSVTVGPGNGHFYAGSPRGGFGAVRVDKPSFQSGSLPVTPWPKFHHDIQNSGWSH